MPTLTLLLRHPIWVLGSETHFTVLFSLDRRLVAAVSPREEGKRVFARFDEASNGFIPVRSGLVWQLRV